MDGQTNYELLTEHTTTTTKKNKQNHHHTRAFIFSMDGYGNTSFWVNVDQKEVYEKNYAKCANSNPNENDEFKTTQWQLFNGDFGISSTRLCEAILFNQCVVNKLWLFLLMTFTSNGFRLHDYGQQNHWSIVRISRFFSRPAEPSRSESITHQALRTKTKVQYLHSEWCTINIQFAVKQRTDMLVLRRNALCVFMCIRMTEWSTQHIDMGRCWVCLLSIALVSIEDPFLEYSA